jgi:hypothetical protein
MAPSVMVHGDGGVTGSGGAVVEEEGEEAIGIGKDYAQVGRAARWR